MVCLKIAKLAAMLRIVQALQFIFAKLASLLRGEGRDEMRAGELSAKRAASPKARLINKAHRRPAITRLQCRKRRTNPIEKR